MQNEVIKTALQHPEIMEDVISSPLLEEREKQKLSEVHRLYLKHKKLPSETVLNKLFSIDLGTENESDVDLVYQTLHQLNVDLFVNKVYDRLYSSADGISIEEIHELEKTMLKSYGEQCENRFLIQSPQDLLALKQRLDNREESFLETGFSSINNLTKGSKSDNSGGWHPGALYSVMGLSGYGKSIFLANFARDIWEKENNVLYISTEMDELETYERILKSKYKAKSFDEIVLSQNQTPFPDAKIEVIKVHPNDTTCSDIQHLIDTLTWNPDILIIDYADELKSNEGSSEYEAQGIVYAGLKKIAEVNHLPVLTATQTNRAAEDSKNGGTKDWVGMSSIADSSKKIRLVDMLFAITQSRNDKVGNILNLLVLKNRFGESNVRLSFAINYLTMRLEEIEVKKEKKPAKIEKKEQREYYPAEKILFGDDDE